jgi:hypothetical protein
MFINNEGTRDPNKDSINFLVLQRVGEMENRYKEKILIKL